MADTSHNEITRPISSPDFNFLMGKWAVHHRRLKDRLAGCSDWEEFEGTAFAQKLLGGQANVDDHILEFPSGHYRAASLRSYDPFNKQWSIWWLDSRIPGYLDPPVVGKFVNGIGTFYSDDMFKDQPVRIRFRWMDTLTRVPHWDQAFSADGGTTWELNWTMDFTRLV